ncbi:AAA family ATPase [Nitrosophilus labii]|uniref:AAA family ATPase n=1 Tax=Nitrosophilus labii TaxID=2706014 RepID=UPI001656BA74|nr:ATP-binding protein [Nitrosophilus labii]
MKRINSIKLKNFKFFYDEETLKFNKKNILVYGENGSGKSSLYWALYTFLQSSFKDDEGVKKYFDKENSQNLINKFVDDLQKDDAFIELELIDTNLQKTTTYKISKNIINTNKKEDTQIKKANLTSDFINYRLLSKIYDFKNSQDIDLWSFFEDYILDFIVFTESEYENLANFWEYLKKGLEKINNRYPTITSSIYKDFQSQITKFNEKMENLLNEISRNTNKLLQNAFKENIEIKFSYKKATYNDFLPNSKKRNHKTLPPKINIEVTFFDEKIDKPHTFLNEARLTAIALSIRFAILKNRLIRDDVLKILVLDDLLISLDMSKRFEVIDILLNDEDLKEYQKIILTHDRGFFNLMLQKINQFEWKIFEFYNKKENGIEKQCIKEYKDNLTKARELFENQDFDTSANYLRKEAESILKKFLDPNLKYINREFQNLEELIRRVKNELDNEFINKFNRVFKFTKKENEDLIFIYEKELLEKIDTDFENDNNLDPNQKGKLRGLKKKLFDFTKEYYEIKKVELEIFNELKKIKDRVLNPASHNSEAPLFKKEIEEAIELIHRLKEFLKDKKTKREIKPTQVNCSQNREVENSFPNWTSNIVIEPKEIIKNIRNTNS